LCIGQDVVWRTGDDRFICSLLVGPFMPIEVVMSNNLRLLTCRLYDSIDDDIGDNIGSITCKIMSLAVTIVCVCV
jgi:hypothetical protein